MREYKNIENGKKFTASNSGFETLEELARYDIVPGETLVEWSDLAPNGVGPKVIGKFYSNLGPDGEAGFKRI